VIQELGAAAVASAEATPPSTAVGFLPPPSNYHQYRTLSEIRGHTIIVSAGADILTSPAHSRDLAAGIPRAVHVHLPNAGHMLPQEASSVISDAIGRAVLGSHPIDPRIAEASGRVFGARRRGSTSQRCSG
jgi:pimeloyl-ACP methyl ester carboxylesterase